MSFFKSPRYGGQKIVRQIKAAKRRNGRFVSLRSDKNFIKSSYSEVFEILRYFIPAVLLCLIPFITIDLKGYWLKRNNLSIVTLDLILVALGIVFIYLQNFSKNKRVKGKRKKYVALAGVAFISTAGTAMNLLIIKYESDISIFAAAQLSTAMLFRFPDNRKMSIIIINYLIFHSFLWNEQIFSSILWQNSIFIFLLTIAFDRISFLTKASSYYKNEKIRSLSRKLEKETADKEEILRIAVHDLKSPISGIVSLSGILLENKDKIGKKFVENLYTTSKSILESIDEILFLSNSNEKNQERKSGNFVLEELTEEVIANLDFSLSAKSISIKRKLNEKNIIFGNRKVFYRILDNLLGNSIKYSKPKSTIRLKIRSEKGDTTRRGKVILEIHDAGPGFSSEDLEKGIQEFQKLSARPTGNESSTGLGLSIVQKMLVPFGAEITIGNSELTGGAFVVLRLSPSRSREL
ncbi:sensor histidine kinase [Leptospira gomenensis]|uniref:histidine kinase n=1 Tax=Leptospira gomenensis TaxID=2484974 RepID=A0A5F1Z0D8_9LEPT|nr:HAMP domain-containing sensor histidine kinase [Leptospira gomenensis]TGK36453.1 sensor histidine kinase [Leptospira gomenensis]TGK38282.1 sensor histidine kinase [Leptospira gomenensis]TGK46023.1 sensor histidine kinase [Leptospira gomenensis]TGK65287.1 sensor histidine kinase [Leptospira gomenensis]